MHTKFLSSTSHSNLLEDKERADRSSTFSQDRSITPPQIQDKENASQPTPTIVEETESVIDMQLAPGEAVELDDNQETEKSVDPCTSSLGQVSFTSNTILNETKKESREVLQSSLCKALANVLGSSEEISGFDKLHRRLKATTRCRTAIEDERKYMGKLAHFQKLVLAETSATKQALQKLGK